MESTWKPSKQSAEKLIAAAEERAQTCARAYVAGKYKVLVAETDGEIEEAYRKGWFMGGQDNGRMIEQSTSEYVPFVFGMVVGAVCAIMLLVAFQVIP